MLQHIPLSFLPMVLLAGCTQAPPPAPRDVRSERIARLEKLARSCGLPAETVKLEGEDELHLKPSPDAPYESVDCLLRALEKSGMPMKMGFVGNEAYDSGNQQ